MVKYSEAHGGMHSGRRRRGDLKKAVAWLVTPWMADEAVGFA